MVPLGQLDSFVQLCFAVNTIFSFYVTISSYAFRLLDWMEGFTERYALAIALNLDDTQQRAAVETYTQGINSKTVVSKNVHLLLTRTFRSLSGLLAVYCILLIKRQTIPVELTGMGAWWLISPAPLYLVGTLLVGVIQIVMWGYKVCRLSQIVRKVPQRPPFRLPDIPNSEKKNT